MEEDVDEDVVKVVVEDEAAKGGYGTGSETESSKAEVEVVMDVNPRSDSEELPMLCVEPSRGGSTTFVGFTEDSKAAWSPPTTVPA